MPDFCENCNPHSSYHTTAVGERLVDIQFAETCKLTLFTFLKIFYLFEKWVFMACSNRQFEHAVLYVFPIIHPSLPSMYHICNLSLFQSAVNKCLCPWCKLGWSVHIPYSLLSKIASAHRGSAYFKYNTPLQAILKQAEEIFL